MKYNTLKIYFYSCFSLAINMYRCLSFKNVTYIYSENNNIYTNISLGNYDIAACVLN